LPLISIASAANLRHDNPRDPSALAQLADADVATTSDYASAAEFRLTLSNYKGVQYTAPITLNNQKLHAVYDTGSFEVMAMSTKCTVCKVPATETKYNSLLSQSFLKGDGSVSVHSFAGGKVTATRDYETVHLGDVGNEFTLQHMPFWQVFSTDMRVWMKNKAQFTAIVGLGHRKTLPGQKTDALLERTDTHRFAICLRKGQLQPGYLTFNPTMHQPIGSMLGAVGSMYKRLPVIGKSHWAVRMDDVTFTVGGVSSSGCLFGESCLAIVDSGTSLIGVPPSAVKMIGGLSKLVKEDCSNMDTLPDLVWKLAGKTFTMPPSSYVVRWPKDGGIQCVPAFTKFDLMTTSKVWVLGMPFFRTFYTVFDRTEPSLYIAEQGPNCEPAAAASHLAKNLSTGFAARGLQEPSFVDIAEATLPSWASAGFDEDM